jgi:hypothetical protein
MSAEGQKPEVSRGFHVESALPPITDINDPPWHVRKVPQADFPLATSDVLVKAALDIGATWSERRCRIAVGNAAIDAWKGL